MSAGDLSLVQTCVACPEQYDVYRDGAVVGYLRLRHGHFTARLFGPDGPMVYEATPRGDGAFDDDERDEYLRKATNAIQLALEQGPPTVPDPEPGLGDEYWAWQVFDEDDGDWCVVGVMVEQEGGNNMHMPLIFRRREQIDQTCSLAMSHSKGTGQRLRLAHFTLADVVDWQ